MALPRCRELWKVVGRIGRGLQRCESTSLAHDKHLPDIFFSSNRSPILLSHPERSRLSPSKTERSSWQPSRRRNSGRGKIALLICRYQVAQRSSTATLGFRYCKIKFCIKVLSTIMKGIVMYGTKVFSQRTQGDLWSRIAVQLVLKSIREVNHSYS